MFLDMLKQQNPIINTSLSVLFVKYNYILVCISPTAHLRTEIGYSGGIKIAHSLNPAEINYIQI